jgi:hypothetical protein
MLSFEAIADKGRVTLFRIWRDYEGRQSEPLETMEPEEADALRQSLYDAVETAKSQRSETNRRTLEKLRAQRAALDEQIAEIERREKSDGIA